MYNFGLGHSNRTETFLFNPGVKGNTGIRGAQSTSFDKEKVVPVEVVIKNASNEILKIIDTHSSQDIIVKMDCEGGEYEIMKNLNETGVLKKIKALAIEWHDLGSVALLACLKEHGFTCFYPNLARNSGMIYAVNTTI